MGCLFSVEVSVEEEARTPGAKSSRSSSKKGGATSASIAPNKSSSSKGSNDSRQGQSGTTSTQSGRPSQAAGGGPEQPRRMKLSELSKATNNFSKKNQLGEGSFGQVFRGTLPGPAGGVPVPVAVKMLNPESSQGMDEWLAEVLLLPSVQHPNLVKLLGYCAEKGEAILVYELCENGSLDDKLFPDAANAPVLSWAQRIQVARETADALSHLHANKIIHRDLKPSNILLDSNYTAKLCDFGMAKQAQGGETHVSTRVMGTLGFLDPAYMETGCLREQSDAYSFGVILLQLLTGRDAVDDRNVKLVDWMQRMLLPQVADPQKFMDPALDGNYPRAGAQLVAGLAGMCTEDAQEDRPDMAYVTERLNEVPLA